MAEDRCRILNNDIVHKRYTEKRERYQPIGWRRSQTIFGLQQGFVFAAADADHQAAESLRLLMSVLDLLHLLRSAIKHGPQAPQQVYFWHWENVSSVRHQLIHWLFRFPFSPSSDQTLLEHSHAASSSRPRPGYALWSAARAGTRGVKSKSRGA